MDSQASHVCGEKGMESGQGVRETLHDLLSLRPNTLCRKSLHKITIGAGGAKRDKGTQIPFFLFNKICPFSQSRLFIVEVLFLIGRLPVWRWTSSLWHHSLLLLFCLSYFLKKSLQYTLEGYIINLVIKYP